MDACANKGKQCEKSEDSEKSGRKADAQCRPHKVSSRPSPRPAHRVTMCTLAREVCDRCMGCAGLGSNVRPNSEVREWGQRCPTRIRVRGVEACEISQTNSCIPELRCKPICPFCARTPLSSRQGKTCALKGTLKGGAHTTLRQCHV